jgi:cytochrome c peroxidase
MTRPLFHRPVALLLASMALGFAVLGVADEPVELKIPSGLPKMRIPTDNKVTAAKIALGKQLFFDNRVSIDNSVSCASCHDPAKGWSNGETFATGVGGQKGGRNTPTIVNSGYQTFQFWDGRALKLEGQSLGPIENPIEMNMPLGKLTERINAIPGYRKQFVDIFGGPATNETIAAAISTYERTILSGDAPYDRFVAGDKNALSASAQRGLEIFNNKGHCSACHPGPKFTDGGFHNLGVGMNAPRPDVGREAISKLLGDRGSFKTPTLREIARTGPYMHDGSHATLEAVVDLYDRGGNPNPQLDEEIFPLNLTAEEKADLVTFLKEGLAGADYPAHTKPKLPE